MSPFELHTAPNNDYQDIRRIGIPRALLYYRYHVMWRTFFETLGCDVIESDASDRDILSRGEILSIDECCLASKLYFGHAEKLLDECDALFVPSVNNIGIHLGFCTKFQSLPDLVTNTFATRHVRIVSCEIDEDGTGVSEEDAFISIALRFGLTKKQSKAAYRKALQAQQDHDEQQAKAQMDTLNKTEKLPEDERPLRILLAAHPYVIHDSFVGEPIATMLTELEVCTLFADHYDHKKAREASFDFSETMPWIVNREIIGAILNLYDAVDGIVLISAFPCGPDSMTNDALIRCIKGKPILSLTVDAQSGTAGLETRLESFVDILRYQKKGGYLHE